MRTAVHQSAIEQNAMVELLGCNTTVGKCRSDGHGNLLCYYRGGTGQRQQTAGPADRKAFSCSVTITAVSSFLTLLWSCQLRNKSMFLFFPFTGYSNLHCFTNALAVGKRWNSTHLQITLQNYLENVTPEVTLDRAVGSSVSVLLAVNGYHTCVPVVISLRRDVRASGGEGNRQSIGRFEVPKN